jgi:hypothetical protein
MRIAVVAIAIALGVAACTRVVELSPADARGADASPLDGAWEPDADFVDDAAWPDAGIGFPDAVVTPPIDAGPPVDAGIDARF